MHLALLGLIALLWRSYVVSEPIQKGGLRYALYLMRWEKTKNGEFGWVRAFYVVLTCEENFQVNIDHTAPAQIVADTIQMLANQPYHLATFIKAV